MSTFVLVHGAWHGGWCWHKIAARLMHVGHKVIAPDMRAHGIDRMPPEETTLAILADGICDAVAAQAEKVVLVGHSFGGTIIGEVAEKMPEKIARLAYLTAFVVPPGKSMRDLNDPDPESLLAPHLLFAPDNRTITVDPAYIRDCFYAGCPDEDVMLARALLVPEGTAAFGTPVGVTNARWGRVPSAYIECTADRAIGIGRQRRFAENLNQPRRVSLDTDHSPFFSAPDRLCTVLTELG